jgi:hypothetical protein
MTGRVVIPAQAGIQYAAASRFYPCHLWNTGSPAYAGDDEGPANPSYRNLFDEVLAVSREVDAVSRRRRFDEDNSSAHVLVNPTSKLAIFCKFFR